jgi:hypothetical protein
MLIIVAIIRNKAIQITGLTVLPTAQYREVVPSSYLKLIAAATATNSSEARTPYANLQVVRWHLVGTSGRAYQYIQPMEKPTPRSRKRRGNSITGALTGIKAVISIKQDITDDKTVPMRT